jgi:hypothetical protein
MVTFSPQSVILLGGEHKAKRLILRRLMGRVSLFARGDD